jgi:hypothetical protein
MEKTNSISMEHNMDSSRYTPALGFWIATTFVIIITVFPIIILGTFSAMKDENATNLWLTFGLALIPGSCVGLLQTFMMAHPSIGARVQWLGATVVSTSIGWCIVFVIWTLIVPSRITIGTQLGPAVFYGFLAGAFIGAIFGLVTGIIQGRIQPLSAREWLVGNLISWSIGIGVPLAVFFGGISQIRLF